MTVCRLYVRGEHVSGGYVREALGLGCHQREVEGKHHDLGYLSPGYVVVWPECAVVVSGYYLSAVEECHLSKVGVALGHVIEAQRACTHVVTWRNTGRLLVRIVAVVAV